MDPQTLQYYYVSWKNQEWEQISKFRERRSEQIKCWASVHIRESYIVIISVSLVVNSNGPSRAIQVFVGEELSISPNFKFNRHEEVYAHEESMGVLVPGIVYGGSKAPWYLTAFSATRTCAVSN